uniref:Uncharacterized protein n=1 Tax=Onchocerca volvulus TaxID=6282 RepID=A0A8R1Y2J2_ONCVO
MIQRILTYERRENISAKDVTTRNKEVVEKKSLVFKEFSFVNKATAQIFIKLHVRMFYERDFNMIKVKPKTSE